MQMKHYIQVFKHKECMQMVHCLQAYKHHGECMQMKHFMQVNKQHRECKKMVHYMQVTNNTEIVSRWNTICRYTHNTEKVSRWYLHFMKVYKQHGESVSRWYTVCRYTNSTSYKGTQCILYLTFKYEVLFFQHSTYHLLVLNREIFESRDISNLVTRKR